MGEITLIEKKLITGILRSELISSLHSIRNATEKIWASDAPRIIKDYTDHGIEHSKRIIKLSNKLLDANDGHDLIEEERYLLVASIYLHDIGMQCDIVKYPEIQKIAEKLGATFNEAFCAQSSSEYNIEEQKMIRKNHHYLTAAWIEYSCNNSDSTLNQAIETIPKDLIGDLIDICMHHSVIPITNCPKLSNYNPNQRKQFIASILRFADELDIDSTRVTIETVENFRLDPNNSIYWWLHNRTKIIFPSRNVILYNILLNPEDNNRYGPIIYELSINKFINKNRPVINVLARNGIPIVISDDSGIKENIHEKRLPENILKFLSSLETKENPLLEFVNEVRSWLQAIGYDVSKLQFNSERIQDLIAVLDSGTIRQRVLVRCIGGEITKSNVDELDKILDRKTPQGWLISDIRVCDEARQEAAKDDAIQVFNLSDFLKQMVWAPYINFLTFQVEKEKIPKYYVDPECYKEEMDEEGRRINQYSHSSLDEYLDNWLSERGKMHISLLGEFGSGKTWFCKHYANRQLEKYIKNPVKERLPLLITLRSFTKSTTAEQLINDALLEQYKLTFVGSAFQIFQEMNRRGKLLLILDGFDEMARQVDYQTVVDNFWELARLVDANSKVILTSRTEYFRWAKESQKILGGEEFGRRTIVLTPPQFEVLYLKPFNDNQIRKAIKLRLGSGKGDIVAEIILQTNNLAEMVRKPVLIELLLAVLDDVNQDVLKNSTNVYLYATNKLLLRNIDTKRTFTSTTDKLFFLCELAWEMILNNKLRIHYTEIPQRIKTFFGDKIKDQHELDNWDFDLRSQTLLHRDAAGYYEFAHKSLAEYFVAFKFASELGCLSPIFKNTYREADNKSCIIPIDEKDIITLSKTFGALKLTDERMQIVYEFLKGILHEESRKKLWKIIFETKDKSPEEIQYAAGNAVTLLGIYNEKFKNKNLEGTVIKGANFFNTDLTDCNLKNSHFLDNNLINCTLENVDLRKANINGTKIIENDEIYSVIYSSDGKWVACCGNMGFLKIWNKNFTYEQNLLWNSEKIWNVKLSKNNKYLAAIGRGDTISIWKINNWSQKKIDGLKTNYVCDIIWIDDEQILVSGCDGSINLIDCNKKQIGFSRILSNFPIHCISQNSITKEIAAGCSNGEIFILDDNLREKKQISKTIKSKFVSFATSLQYSPNGDLLFIGDNNGTLEILNAENYKLIKTIHIHEKESNLLNEKYYIRNISFSPIREHFAISGHYDISGVWDYRKWERIMIFNHDVTSLCFNPDGNRIITGGFDSTIRVWDVEPKSKNFGVCKKIINTSINCKNMKINEVSGFEKEMHWLTNGESHNGSLYDFLIERGAITSNFK